MLLLYSTGLGLNSPGLQTGALVARDARIDTQPVTVTIGGQSAEVIYSIASPGFAGLSQTAVRVPSGLPGATAPVVLRAGMAASNAVNLAIAGVSQGERFEITVANLTTGQTFTPILAASHGQGMRLFDEGQPASQQLEILAEDGATGPLKSLLAGNPLVRDITDTGMNPLPPGQSVTLTVRTDGAFDHISVAAMLVPTNDAFFAINGMRMPAGDDAATFESVAYDSGTESNDERCASIPGPPNVCRGEGFNPSRAGAEGTVQMHGGIRGGGDLNAAERNWRNPVARVTVRRLR
ncbi:MAG: spondin domain-containing protein [Verrucomicrobiota bacterium]|nr:spondin domain-containing protein [Verrucomicrobiota bacterium]